MRKFSFIGILLGFSAVACAILLQAVPTRDSAQHKVQLTKHQKTEKPQPRCELSLLDSFLPASAQFHLHFDCSFIKDIFNNQGEQSDNGHDQDTNLSPGKYFDVLLKALISPNAP